jgi:hypothetical protein
MILFYKESFKESKSFSKEILAISVFACFQEDVVFIYRLDLQGTEGREGKRRLSSA